MEFPIIKVVKVLTITILIVISRVGTIQQISRNINFDQKLYFNRISISEQRDDFWSLPPPHSWVFICPKRLELRKESTNLFWNEMY